MSKKNKPVYDLKDLKFKTDVDPFEKINIVIDQYVYFFSRLTPLNSPLKNTNLVNLGQVTGVNSQIDLSLLEEHKQRLELYRILTASLSLFISLSIYFAFIYLNNNFGILNNLAIINRTINVLSFDFFIYFFIVFFAATLLSQYGVRLATFFMDKRFADTLCVATSLFILTEASKDDCLSHPHQVKRLLFRLKVLARNTLLLSYYYESNNTQNNEWTIAFFRKIEGQIRELERQVIAPNTNSLKMLREKIYQLTISFISRRFVRTSYKIKNTIQQNDKSGSNLFIGTIANLTSIILPILLLWVTLFIPNQLEKIGMSTNIIGTIGIFWLIISLDIFLKTGVVDRIVNLAKALRELK